MEKESKIFCVVVASILFITWNMKRSKSKNIERRAAIDVGSGSTKLMVADVDIRSNRILKILFRDERPVSYSLVSNQHPLGNLSDEVMEKGIAVLQDYISISASLGVRAPSAIATEVFRKAPNGQEFLRRIWRSCGLDVRLVSQLEEAELGFRTAASFSSKEDKFTVCWDCGGGSFQISAIDPITSAFRDPFVGALGSGVICAQALKLTGRQGSPHPLSHAHVSSLVTLIKSQLAPSPKWISNVPEVTGIGGGLSMFRLVELLIGKVTFEAIDVEHCLEMVINKSDDELARYGTGETHLIVGKLALLLATMQHCEIKSVRFCFAIGSCPGILIHPSYRTFEVSNIFS